MNRLRSIPSLWILSSLALLACGANDPQVTQMTPVISAFAADRVLVPPGASSTLRWITLHATSVQVLADGSPIGGADAGVEKGSLTVEPKKTTEYTLVARGGGGKEARSSVTIAVEEGTKVEAKIWVEPTTIAFGEKATLHWATAHATEVSITRNGSSLLSSAGELSGSRAIETHETTEYRLVAKGPLGDAEATALLQVRPAIQEFHSNVQHPVFPGDQVEVQWRVSGADSVEITTTDGYEHVARKESFTRGSVRATVAKDGKFRLVAARAGVESVQELEVPLVGPPEIARFVVTPPAVSEGMPPKDQVRVSWQILNVSAIRLESSHHGVIDLSGKRPSADGIVVTDVPAGTNFRLVATNAMAEAEASWTVEAVPFATIDSLRVVPARIAKGDPVFVTWKTSGATSIALHQNQPPVKKRLIIDPSSVVGTYEMEEVDVPTSFILEATNPAEDSVEREVEVHFAAPAAQVELAARQVRPGADVVFRWDNEGGSKLQILESGVPLFETVDIWEIDQGSATLSAPMAEGEYRYEVVVSNRQGSQRKELFLIVSTGPEILDFQVDPGPVRAGDSISFRWSVTNDAGGNRPTLTLEDDAGTLYDLGAVDPNEGQATFPVQAAGLRKFTLSATTPASSQPSLAEATSEIFGAPELTVNANPLRYDPFNRIPVTIHWQTRFATEIGLYRIDEAGNVLGIIFEDGRRTVAASGSRTFVPQAPGEWVRVVASNPWGEQAEEDFYAEYMVPTIHSFQVSATSIPKNGTVTVSWDTGGGPAFLNAPLVSTQPMFEGEDKPFTPIANVTGTQILNMQSCPSSSADDEGCIDVPLPAGFSFPFDGKYLTTVRPYTNGWINLDLTVPKPGSMWSQISGITLPTATHRYIQLAGYGQDLHGMPTMHWREANDAEGRHVVFEWNPNFGGAGQFQIALYEDGSFEYRYGSLVTSSNRAPVFVGYQNLAGTRAFTLPGGSQLSTLQNKVWRYEPRVGGTGSQTYTLSETTTFRLCVRDASGVPLCEDKVVTVSP